MLLSSLSAPNWAPAASVELLAGCSSRSPPSRYATSAVAVAAHRHRRRRLITGQSRDLAVLPRTRVPGRTIGVEDLLKLVPLALLPDDDRVAVRVLSDMDVAGILHAIGQLHRRTVVRVGRGRVEIARGPPAAYTASTSTWAPLRHRYAAITFAFESTATRGSFSAPGQGSLLIPEAAPNPSTSFVRYDQFTAPLSSHTASASPDPSSETSGSVELLEPPTSCSVKLSPGPAPR